MAFIIAELGPCPDDHQNADENRAICMFIREEVQFDPIAQCEEHPIVNRIDENSLNGH